MGKHKVSVRIDASGSLAEKITFLKEKLGTTTYKGLVETLIILKYEELKENGRS